MNYTVSHGKGLFKKSEDGIGGIENPVIWDIQKHTIWIVRCLELLRKNGAGVLKEEKSMSYNEGIIVNGIEKLPEQPWTGRITRVRFFLWTNTAHYTLDVQTFGEKPSFFQVYFIKTGMIVGFFDSSNVCM